MPTVHKPRSGSLQFWPRKRARRIYPNIRRYPDVKEAKPLLFAGYKAGMTRVISVGTKKNAPTYGEVMSKSVTVIEVPPLFVAGARFYREIEERMEAIGEVYSDNIPKNFKEVLNTSKRKLEEFEGADDVRLIVATQPFSAGLSKKKPDVFEVGLGGTFEEKMNYVKEKLGKNLDISEVFEEGEYVDVIAVTKGKGFQGVVKRYGVKIRGRKDEQHHRQIGIMGPRGVARVLYTVPQPGQMGYHRRTEYNKYIVKIGDNPDEVNPKGGFIRYGLVRSKYVLLRGSVPGPKKRLVMMRKSIRGKGKRRVEIQEIETYSQQGVRYG